MPAENDSGTPKTPAEETAGSLGRELVQHMHRMTYDRIGEMGLVNAMHNEKYFSHGKSIKDLRAETVGEGDSAVIIAAGPSVRRQDPLKILKEHGYKGAIVATESAMYYCLRNGVVPDLVVTVDPHALRIVRWFGDPDLCPQRIAADDYYRRQDMDDNFARELETNKEIMDLLAEYGPRIRIAVATSASELVVKRCVEIGMRIYWWNPMFDDPDEPESETRELIRRNGLPALNAGGNVGTACWMMAQEVLCKGHVALTGVDLGYYADTPYYRTQYYHEAVALVGEHNLDSLFIPVHNPHLDQWFYTDPTCMWYREALLELAADADGRTYNCTEGGIVFGDSIEFLPLRDFLRAHAR